MSNIGRWYNATYLRYDAPVFCRRVGVEVEVLSRKGIWKTTPDEARKLLQLGCVADADLVERRLRTWSASERKRPNRLPLPARLPSGCWYRATWTGKAELGGFGSGSMLFVRSRDERFFVVSVSGEFDTLTHDQASSLEVLVDVDGDYVSASEHESSVLDARYSR